MKKITKKQLAPYLAVALLSVVWHMLISVGVGDDLIYFGTLLDGSRSIWEILAHRYQTWSSRLVLEFVLIPLVHHVLLWRILDAIVYVTIPMLMCRLLGAGERLRWWVTGFVLLYPFSDMMSAGWISTTTNYLWPLWCALFVGVLLKDMLDKSEVKQEQVWKRWLSEGGRAVGGTLACIYACSQEQVAVILFLVFALSICYFWRRKRYKLPLLYLWSGIDILSLIYILLCPGNEIRMNQEIESRMPQMADFSFWEKLYMGLANVERIFIANLNNVFLVFTVTLTVLVYRKTRNCKKTVVSALPVLILFGQSVVQLSHVRFRNFFVVPEQVAGWDFGIISTYLPLVMLAVCVVGILYALYELMRDDLERYLGTVLLLGGGFASGVVMGFSPTIYASADRPYIYLYFIMIYVCLAQIKAMGRELAELSVDARRLAGVFLSIPVLVNVLDVTWLCYITGRLL